MTFMENIKTNLKTLSGSNHLNSLFEGFDRTKTMFNVASDYFNASTIFDFFVSTKQGKVFSINNIQKFLNENTREFVLRA